MFEGPLQDVIDEFSRLPGIGPKSAQRIALFLLEQDPQDIRRFQEALGLLQSGVAFCRICHNISQGEVCRICADASRDASVICVVEESKDIQVIERTGEFRGRYHVLGGALDPLAGVGPKELNVTSLLQRVGGVLPDVPLAAPGTPSVSSMASASDSASAGTLGVLSAGAVPDGSAGSSTTAPEPDAVPATYADLSSTDSPDTFSQDCAPAPEISEVIIATDPNTEGEATAAYLGRLLHDFPGLRVSRLASGIPMGGDLEFVDELTLSRAFAGRTAL